MWDEKCTEINIEGKRSTETWKFIRIATTEKMPIIFHKERMNHANYESQEEDLLEKKVDERKGLLHGRTEFLDKIIKTTLIKRA